ncbi:beta-xylosidase [Actinokineospora sp. HUAS TT18]|uniref:beta-xylosidase n=1 Tax=Actinokineospora sp. HUAS TT18 TaxID=3447451 RepID=UPI003F527D51
MFRRVALLLAVAGLVSACTAAEGQPVPAQTTSATPVPESRPLPPVALATDRPRQSTGDIAAGGNGAPYNYAPTLLAEDGKYRMWWCSQIGGAGPAGDDILVAEADSPGGPFGPATPVFSGGGKGFDAQHVCDPSVLRVDSTYYLYYTGAEADHPYGSAIGLATSPDGKTWTRANGGAPIVTMSRNKMRDNAYGAGQPAAVYVDGWFYLLFTDTTGSAAGWNGAGQFVLRAKDPTFAVNVEILAPGGFRPDTSTHARLRSVVDAFSVDVMWVDALAAFAIAHEVDGGTRLTFWDKDFREQPYPPLMVPGPWQEGPGLVRDGEGHAPRSVEDPCERVPVDLVRATRIDAAPNGLHHFGLDITGTRACADPARAAGALVGFAVPSPQRTIDLVTRDGLVRVERRAVAEKLAVRVLDARVPALDNYRVQARLDAGAKAVRSESGIGFLLGDKVFPFGDPAVATANSSPVDRVDSRRWAEYERGPWLG